MNPVTDEDVSKTKVEDSDFSEDAGPEAKTPKKPLIPGLLKMAIVGCGLCTGIVSQILFTNMTFFQLMFPTKSPEFVFPLVIVIPQVVGQILSIKYVNQLPFKCGESGLISF